MQTICVNRSTSKFDVDIGRGSIWGNPYPMKDSSSQQRDLVCRKYEDYFWTTDLWKKIHLLRDKKIGCYCKPKKCHGDYLAKLANMKEDKFMNLVDRRRGM